MNSPSSSMLPSAVRAPTTASSPDAAMAELVRGNERFATGRPTHHETRSRHPRVAGDVVTPEIIAGGKVTLLEP